MKWKEGLLGLLGLSAPVSVAEGQSTIDTSDNNPKTEITVDTTANRQKIDTLKAQINHKNGKPKIPTDSTEHTSASKPNLPADTIDFSEAALNMATDTIAQDSVAAKWNKMTPRERLQSCANQMLCFISQFEDIKAVAYYDSIGHKWTVGPGWTSINGRPVTKYTRIRSAEEMFSLWGNDLNKTGGYFDRMEEMIHIDKMQARTAEEVAKQQGALCCFQSFMWNHGSGILGTKNRPSSLVSTYNTFLDTRDSVYLAKSVEKYLQYDKVSKIIRKNGKKYKVKVTNATLTKRRKAESQVLNGSTILSMGKPETEEAKQGNVWYVELSALGDIYSLTPKKGMNFSEDWIERLNNPVFGSNFNDTITTQFRKQTQKRIAYSNKQR